MQTDFTTIMHQSQHRELIITRNQKK